MPEHFIVWKQEVCVSNTGVLAFCPWNSLKGFGEEFIEMNYAEEARRIAEFFSKNFYYVQACTSWFSKTLKPKMPETRMGVKEGTIG